MKILIAGDLTLQERALNCKWDEVKLNMSFHGVKGIARDCDYALVNLESPVTTASHRILKDGPTLRNPLFVHEIISYCGFNTVTLANNHLKDYGVEGVLDTLEYCKKSNLQTVGAGTDLMTARKPLLWISDTGVRVGVINVCERESSIATTTEPGSNPLDFVNLYYDISSLKKKTDKIIVVIHGGREHYQYPTPRMKRDYHLIADYGADVIVNHHQHCFSGYEIYKGKPIFYGLGNFYFDRKDKRNDIWNYGLLLKLYIQKDDIKYELIPYEQCNQESVIRVMEFKDVDREIERMSMIIQEDNLLEEEFEKLIKKVKPLYPFIPFGGKLLRSLYFRGLLPKFVSRKNLALMENAVRCETHREVLLSYMNNKIHNE